MLTAKFAKTAKGGGTMLTAKFAKGGGTMLTAKFAENAKLVAARPMNS